MFIYIYVHLYRHFFLRCSNVRLTPTVNNEVQRAHGISHKNSKALRKEIAIQLVLIVSILLSMFSGPVLKVGVEGSETKERDL